MVADAAKVAPVAQEVAVTMSASEMKMYPIVAITSDPDAQCMDRLRQQASPKSRQLKCPKNGRRADLLRQGKIWQVKCADILNKDELVMLLRTRNPMNWKDIIIKAKARRTLTDKAAAGMRVKYRRLLKYAKKSCG